MLHRGQSKRRAKSLSEQGTSLNSFLCLAFFIVFNFLNVFAGENLVNLQCISHLPLCIQVRDIFWNITWQNLKHAGRGSFSES